MSQLHRALFISRKDIRSYYGKPPLITWALLFPAVLMLAIYVRNPENYLNSAPGIIAMTLLFGNTSMAAIVLTFEKRTGTLQRLLLAPVSSGTIILGKSLSAMLYGIATSLVLTLGLMLLLGMRLASPAPFILGLLLGGGIFSLLGLTAAALVREVFEAMTLMNFIRFPILFISGVFVPIESLPAWLKPIAFISPMTYVVELLRLGASGNSYFASPLIPALISLAFLAAAWKLTVFAFRRQAGQ
ncbi:ABC transporter permease [bacterium]|nr:ABC transporter permease [bacterium]